MRKDQSVGHDVTGAQTSQQSREGADDVPASYKSSSHRVRMRTKGSTPQVIQPQRSERNETWLDATREIVSIQEWMLSRRWCEIA